MSLSKTSGFHGRGRLLKSMCPLCIDVSAACVTDIYGLERDRKNCPKAGNKGYTFSHSIIFVLCNLPKVTD